MLHAQRVGTRALRVACVGITTSVFAACGPSLLAPASPETRASSTSAAPAEPVVVPSPAPAETNGAPPPAQPAPPTSAPTNVPFASREESGEGMGGLGEGSSLSLSDGRLGTGDPVPPGAVRFPPPDLREVSLRVTGPLDPVVVRRLLRQRFAQFRACYTMGWQKNPKLRGEATTRFTIEKDGVVTNVTEVKSTLPDKDVMACVQRSYRRAAFPMPAGARVEVVHVVSFAPPAAKVPGKQ